MKLYRSDKEPNPGVISTIWPFISDHTPWPKYPEVAHAVFLECSVGRLMTAVKEQREIADQLVSDIEATCSSTRHLQWTTICVSALLKEEVALSSWGLSPVKRSGGKGSSSQYDPITKAKSVSELSCALRALKAADDDGLLFSELDGGASDHVLPSIMFNDVDDVLRRTAETPKVPRWTVFLKKDTPGRDLSKVFASCPRINLTHRISPPKKEVSTGNVCKFVITAGQELVVIDQGDYVRSGTTPDAPIVLPGPNHERCLKRFFSATSSAGEVPLVFDRMGKITFSGPCSSFATACADWAEDSTARWFSLGAGFIMARRPEGPDAWEAIILFVSPHVHHIQRIPKKNAEGKDQPEAVVQFSLPGRPLFPGVLGVPNARMGSRLLSQSRPMFSSILFEGNKITIGLYAIPPFFCDGKHGKVPKKGTEEPLKDTIFETIVIHTSGRRPTQVISSTLGFHPLFPGTAHHNIGGFVVGDQSGDALVAIQVWIKPHCRDTCRCHVFVEKLGGSKSIEPLPMKSLDPPREVDTTYRFWKRRMSESVTPVEMAPAGHRILAAYDDARMDLHQIILSGDTGMRIMRSRSDRHGGDATRTVSTLEVGPMELFHGATGRLEDVNRQILAKMTAETFVTTIPSTGASSFFVALHRQSDGQMSLARYTYSIDRAPIVDAAGYWDAGPTPPQCAASNGYESIALENHAFFIGPQAKAVGYVPPESVEGLGHYEHQPNMFSAARVLKTPGGHNYLLGPLYYQQLASGCVGETRVVFTMPDSGNQVLIVVPKTEMVHINARETSPNAKRRRISAQDDELHTLADVAARALFTGGVSDGCV